MKRSHLSLAVLTIAIFFTAPARAQQSAPEKRSMTFLDIMQMRAVGGGTISPDGKWVLYTISTPNWKLGKNFTDIYDAPADGSAPPRQLTFTPDKNETQPRWARDSRWFGFLSDRDSTGTEARSQLYLMRRDIGEAREVSDAPNGVGNFAFSRDGKWVAFSSGRAEARQLMLLSLDGEQRPVRLTHRLTPIGSWAWSPDSSRILFLTRDKVDPDDQKRREKKFDVRINDPVEAPEHLWSINITDKTEKRLTQGDSYGVLEFTQSDDNKWVAFRSASTDRHANTLDEVDSEVYLLNLGTGEIRRITNNHIAEGNPVFSPDSRSIVFTAPDDFAYDNNRKLFVVSVNGGEPRKLLPDWDHSANNPSWSADSKTVYFTEGLGVNGHVFAVNVADNKLAQLTHEVGVIGGPGFDHETGLFLMTFSNPEHPNDYYVARPESIGDRARWTRVSNANPQVAGYSLGRYETVQWKSSDGATVEGILVYPVGYEAGKRYPLIVQLHGGPQSAYTNTFSGGFGTYINIYAANGYAVFQPNYRGSDNYGQHFRVQIAGDYYTQAFDDINTGVDDLIKRGIVDSDKMGMMGWSAGGHWCDWTLTHSTRFKAISTGAGASDWISMYAQTDTQQPREFYFKGKPWENWDHFAAESPIKYIANAKTPTLIHSGTADRRVPTPQSDELFMGLKKVGVPVEYINYPNMPHGISDPRYQMVKMVSEFEWFEKWIKGKPGWFEWKIFLDTLPSDSRSGEGSQAAGAEAMDH
jgi:dipeptidyl aminopeptidase/acylaminoacyl peptidase